MSDFISVDIEALGPVPGDYSMVELGACKVDNINENFYMMIQPINDNYTDSARNVLGRSLDYYKDGGYHPEVAMKSFEKWLNKVSKGQPVFVGYNARFDSMFVDYYFWHYLNRNPFGVGSAVDIRSYMMGTLKCKWYETTKKYIRKQFPTRLKHTHNALDDAREQADIFKQILEYNGYYKENEVNE